MTIASDLALLRWRRLACGAALLALAAAPAPAMAQDIAPVGDPLEVALTTGALLPEEVLRSSALTFPAILEAFEREAAARSDQVSADGAFDLMLKGEYYDRLTGFYSGGYGKVEARQPLRPYGAEVFGSYRVSDGTFPTYEDYNYTNNLGEIKVGALFSLLRNRDIDARRFAIEDSRLAASQARLDVMLVQLNVQHEALRAYFRWVAAGEEMRVFEELLEIAEARQIGLTREVNEGGRARIALTENEQNLLRRRTLLEQARRAGRGSCTCRPTARTEVRANRTKTGRRNRNESGCSSPCGLCCVADNLPPKPLSREPDNLCPPQQPLDVRRPRTIPAVSRG